MVALLPVTGITLPFISAGGSSLLVSFAAAGVLLSISRETLEPRANGAKPEPRTAEARTAEGRKPRARPKGRAAEDR